MVDVQARSDTRAPETLDGLGEAQSKCQHIAGVPLQPAVAHALHAVYLAKGIQATTAIEGNTLTEREVQQRIQGELPLPASKEYLGKEIDNILSATNSLRDVIAQRGYMPLDSDLLCLFNAQILNKLSLDDGVVPGQIRSYPVGVPNYRGAPAEDCEYLLDRLCQWLNNDFIPPTDHDEIAYGILKSVVAHLYIAWVHPFGDGNGRTARLIEVKFLLEAGVPSAAAHLLSNHYNLTRTEYYRQLDQASKSGGNVLPFIEYAIQRFADQLRDQLKIIRKQQWDVAWINFVHEKMGELKTESGRRQRKLVLALSQVNEPVARRQIQELTPELARMYAGRTRKTLTRDLNAILKTELIHRVGGKYLARKETILAFLPIVKKEQLIKALREAQTVQSLDVRFENQLHPAA